MKHFAFAALAVAMALTSCGGDKQKAMEQESALERDSLNRIIEQKDNEINDMMGTFNDIEEGFRQISAAQGRVSVAKAGEGSSAQSRIMENMQFIQTTMQQNRELINKLRQQLRESNVKGDELRKTIENLASQLEEKDAEIKKLRAELEAKDIHIAELDEQVANLADNVSNLKEEGNQKSNTISAQDKELHTAWYVFGTKSELKNQKILSNGKVLQQNFNKDYFTKIDIRVDREVKLYSKSAELLTSHPAGSYTLERDAKKQYILRIQDPKKFWSTSKYLVVQVK